MFAKLIDGNIEYAKHYLVHGEKTTINPPKSLFLEYGFKEFVINDVPELEEKQTVEAYYEETDTTIIQKWHIVELEAYEEIETV